jgi:hypothetical protein
MIRSHPGPPHRNRPQMLAALKRKVDAVAAKIESSARLSAMRSAHWASLYSLRYLDGALGTFTGFRAPLALLALKMRVPALAGDVGGGLGPHLRIAGPLVGLLATVAAYALAGHHFSELNRHQIDFLGRTVGLQGPLLTRIAAHPHCC